MTGPLVATYRYRAKRFIPVIHWHGGEYECGPALADAADAIRFAIAYAEAIRECLHSTAFREAQR